MDDLQRRALEAYERGRFREALPWGAVAVAMGGIGSTLGSSLSLLVGVATAALLVWMRVSGQELGRGAEDGIRASMGPWFAVVAWTAWAGGCAACSSQCLLLCCTAGVASAAVLFRQSRGAGVVRLVSGAAVTSLICSTACGGFGVVGVAACSVVVASTVPLRVLADTLTVRR